MKTNTATNCTTDLNGISGNRCVKMYDDINIYSKNQIFYGCGNVPDAGDYSNRIRSIELPTRTCALVHTKKNYEGESRVFCNYSYQRNKIFQTLGCLDDRMQSMRVFELPDYPAPLKLQQMK